MNLSARAAQPSNILIPKHADASLTVIQFLTTKFPRIAKQEWFARIQNGKVHWQCGEKISHDTLCQPLKRVYYYREVAQEIKVPFQEQVLYEDKRIIVVFKPHFLPVTPSGKYVNECLVHRLRISSGIDTITPAHRLDKDTAGIMLFTKSVDVRGMYHNLFMNNAIKKQYLAKARIPAEIKQQFLQQGELHWTVKNRLVKGNPSFLMKVIDGEANSHSEIKLIDVFEDYGLFELEPITGKTHQLRVHMASLGFPILNDKFYPHLQDEKPETFINPLQLHAHSLLFADPFSQELKNFSTVGITLG
ncbi:pseudouridine synthase [Parashewanella spongiae]|uniref:Pseudouridine synthase n=1 Tax=Parashewanella spongiae TaxID=342950 RepID=A0A3A6TXW7_9GAMM|nr:pseudouridine synthase [Parashewanella spongiae]MCL1077189.1 pseudouridine synthase [Parashewanella spongiae]RJY19344.1 pseudouridine synthase [Parashewanella spongiae]